MIEDGLIGLAALGVGLISMVLSERVRSTWAEILWPWARPDAEPRIVLEIQAIQEGYVTIQGISPISHQSG